MKSLKLLLNPRMLVIFMMGFSSGLPFLLIGSTLKAWMTDAKLDIASIGALGIVTAPYNWKVFWAPLIDRYVPPFLGRRRGWLLITNVGLMAVFALMALSNPEGGHAQLTAILAFVAAIISATQDIAIDAFRREYLTTNEFAYGNSLAITGYRIAMIVASALALYIADWSSWQVTYIAMAGFMAVGLIATVMAKEPVLDFPPPKTLKESVIGPLKDFFQRPGALWFLAFLILYKFGDSLASDMTSPFYLREMAFTKSEVASITKLYGFIAVILGGIVGGTIMNQIGLMRSLVLFGIMQALSVTGFAWLHMMGKDITALAIVIIFEQLAIGMATAAFVTFMAALTNRRFTGTQYALLSSMTGLSRYFGYPAGKFIETYGYSAFFIGCSVIAIPGLLILFKLRPVIREIDAEMNAQKLAQGLDR